MTKIIPVGGLALCGVLGWWIGGRLTPDAFTLLLGVIFGLMVAIPVMIIALAGPQRVRHDHYHYSEQNGPQRPTVRPTRYTVIEQDRTSVLLDKIQADLNEIVKVTREWKL